MLINMQNGSVRLKRIFMIHNTHDNGTPDNSYGMITDFGDNGGADESMWMNNVHQHGGYGFRSNFSVVDSDSNIQKFLPPGGSSVWNRKFVANIGSANYPARPRGLILPAHGQPCLLITLLVISRWRQAIQARTLRPMEPTLVLTCRSCVTQRSIPSMETGAPPNFRRLQPHPKHQR